MSLQSIPIGIIVAIYPSEKKINGLINETFLFAAAAAMD